MFVIMIMIGCGSMVVEMMGDCILIIGLFEGVCYLIVMFVVVVIIFFLFEYLFVFCCFLLG